MRILSTYSCVRKIFDVIRQEWSRQREKYCSEVLRPDHLWRPPLMRSGWLWTQSLQSHTTQTPDAIRCDNNAVYCQHITHTCMRIGRDLAAITTAYNIRYKPVTSLMIPFVYCIHSLATVQLFKYFINQNAYVPGSSTDNWCVPNHAYDKTECMFKKICDETITAFFLNCAIQYFSQYFWSNPLLISGLVQHIFSISI